MCDLCLYTTLQKTWKEQKRALAKGDHGHRAHWSPGKAAVTKQVWGQAGKSVCGSGPVRSPVRQEILGTSPVMRLVIQVRCQKYDFLSAVNSALRSPFYRLQHFSDPAICVICPWSVLLSAEGNLFFQNNASQTEAAPFSPPELLHRPSKNQHFGLTKVRYIARCILTAPHEEKLVCFNAACQAPTVTPHF